MIRSLFTEEDPLHHMTQWSCDNFFLEYNLSLSQTISNSIEVLNGCLEIAFSIQIYDICNESFCNVFTVYDTTNDLEILIMEWDTDTNSIHIATRNSDYGLDLISISLPNADTLIPPFDYQYHSVYVGFTDTLHRILIDSKTYYEAIYDISPPLSTVNTSYSLIIGHQSFNGNIKEICIKYKHDNTLQYIDIDVNITKFCSTDNEIFEFAFYDSITHHFVYHSSSKYRYLYKTEVFIIGTDFRNRDPQNIDVVDLFCRFDDLYQCVGNWNVYNPRKSRWIIDADTVIVPCDDICVSNSTANNDGTYVWFDYHSLRRGSVYRRGNGRYLMPIILTNNDHSHMKYLWQFVGPTKYDQYSLKKISKDYDERIVVDSCVLGYDFGPHYVFDPEGCSSYITIGYQCKRQEYGCFEEWMNVSVYVDDTAIAYWDGYIYVLQSDASFYRSVSKKISFKRRPLTNLPSVNFHLLDWTQEQNMLYVLASKLYGINLNNGITFTETLPNEARSVCNNISHLFTIGTEILAFEINTKQWTLIVETFAGYGANCCVHHDNMFIFGGTNPVNRTILFAEPTTTQSTTYSIYRYDTISNSLQFVNATLAFPSVRIKSVLIGDDIYLYSGMLQYPYSLEAQYYTQIFNTLTQQIYVPYSKDEIFDQTTSLTAPAGYYDERRKEFFVYSKNTIYRYNDDGIVVDFTLIDKQMVIPGHAINIIHSLQFLSCHYNYSFSASFLLFSSEIGIDHLLLIEQNICTKICSGVEYNECMDCTNGIIPIILSDENVSPSYNLDIIAQTPRVPSLQSSIIINLRECPIGTGKVENALFLECRDCQTQHFKLIEGNKACYSCLNNQNADGISCEGQHKLHIDYNIYLIVMQQKTNDFISPFDITQNDSIYSMKCSPQTCCQIHSGCYYIEESKDNVTNGSYQLCARYRDVYSILCSRCMDGKYEMVGTTACGDCTRYNNLLYLIPIGILAALFDFFILFTSKPINPAKYIGHEINWKGLLLKDELRALSVLFTKIMVYYYQSLSQIIYTKSITNVLLPLIAIFDLTFDFNNDASGVSGFCMIPFIQNPLIEILLSLIFIILSLLQFVWVAFVVWYCFKAKLGTQQTEIIEERQANITQVTTQDTFVETAIISILKLIVIAAGTLLSVAFKLLSCSTLPNGHIVHVFDSMSTCFSIYWWLGLCLCLSVVCLFIFLYYKIWKQKPKERQSAFNRYRFIIATYQSDVWYFEFILFSRRIIIAFCSSIQFQFRDSLMTSILVIYFGIHCRYLPFKYTRLNIVEGVCLLALIFVSNASNLQNQETSVYVAVVISIPFLFFVYCLFSILKTSFTAFKTTTITDREMKKIAKLKTRTPIPIYDDVEITTQTDVTDDADNSVDESKQIQMNEIEMESLLPNEDDSSTDSSDVP